MRDAGPARALSVGIVATPRFTMLAFSAFVDTLRLAADEADRSRQIRCAWRLMTVDGNPVRASNGISVHPAGGLTDPTAFDYLVVVSGTLGEDDADVELDAYLRRAAASGVPLIGLCTGSFALARAGLMKGYRACVSWLHRDELASAHPDLTVVADTLYVIDRDRVTCAGGTGAIHLASALVERHLGPGSSDKGLRIMLEEERRDENATQPPPSISTTTPTRDARIRKALLEIERSLDTSITTERLAAVSGSSPRQLRRLFADELGNSIGSCIQQMRLEKALRLITGGHESITQIASECGFSDAAHFSRTFRSRFGAAPTTVRRQARGIV